MLFRFLVYFESQAEKSPKGLKSKLENGIKNIQEKEKKLQEEEKKLSQKKLFPLMNIKKGVRLKNNYLNFKKKVFWKVLQNKDQKHEKLLKI